MTKTAMVEKMKLFRWLVLFLVLCSRTSAQAEGLFTLPLDNDSYTNTCDFFCHDNRPGANDFGIIVGTNIQAALGGTIHIFDNGLPNENSSTGGYGNYAKIDHGIINGHHWETTYGHMTTGTFIVDSGSHVYQGQIFGKSGNSGWSSGPHLHFEVRKDGTPVDPYSDTEWLWTTHPTPSHGYFSKATFTFPSGSSEGMMPNSSMTAAPLGGSYNEWRVQVNGVDPGVDSPEYPAGMLTKNIVIEFAAKAITGGNHPLGEGRVYVKDENNNWDNSVQLQLINGEVDYNNGQFAVDNYNVYRATLSGITRPGAQMKQFSIQLTNGHGASETWTFDWIKIYTKTNSWDFKDNSLGWTIKKNGQTEGYVGNEWWRIQAAGNQVQVISAENLVISADAKKIGIRYSLEYPSPLVAGETKEEVMRVYFDVAGDNSFKHACTSSDIENKRCGLDGKHFLYQAIEVNFQSGDNQKKLFDLPDCINPAIIKRVMFDLIDNNKYEGKKININNIKFLTDDEHATIEMPSYSSFYSDSSGGGTGDYVFAGSTMCETVVNNAPVGKNYSFTPADGYVGYFLELADVYDSLSIDVKWFRPNGTLLGECNNVSDWPTNVYWQVYRKSRFMDISGQTDYGTWRAELWVNGSKINTQYFSLSENGSSGPPPEPDSDGDGTPDSLDGCPSDPSKSMPGVCGCDTLDIDSDGDGTMDCQDSCPDDVNKTSPGYCGCGTADIDSDGDGVYDCDDSCPSDPEKTVGGICGCGVSDVDSDGDGTVDCEDACPNNPNKVIVGPCGCDDVCPDLDGDGTPDYADACPLDPAKINPGQCGCGVTDIDTDGDGIADCLDAYPDDPYNGLPGLEKPVFTLATVSGPFELTLGWLDIPEATGYCVYRRDTLGNEIVFETFALSLVDDTLAGVESYSYQLQAFNFTNESLLSDAKCFSTTDSLTAACLCPPADFRHIIPE